MPGKRRAPRSGVPVPREVRRGHAPRRAGARSHLDGCAARAMRRFAGERLLESPGHRLAPPLAIGRCRGRSERGAATGGRQRGLVRSLAAPRQAFRATAMHRPCSRLGVRLGLARRPAAGPCPTGCVGNGCGGGVAPGADRARPGRRAVGAVRPRVAHWGLAGCGGVRAAHSNRR